MAREHIPDATVGSVPGLEIRRGVGVSSTSEGGQSAHSLALTSLSSRRLRGIPVAQKVDAKRYRYLDSSGNVVARAEALSLAGGVIYYQDAADPCKGQLRQRGRFVSEDHARTIAGSDYDSQDGRLAGIDEDEAEDHGFLTGIDEGEDHGAGEDEVGETQVVETSRDVWRGREDGEGEREDGDDSGDEEKEEGEQHACIEAESGEQARPRLGDTVEVVVENGPGFEDADREGTKGLTGTIVEDDGSDQPFRVALANGKSLWYRQHWVKLQRAQGGQAEEDGDVQVVKTGRDFWRVQIEAVYRKRNPQKLDDVPRLLEQNEGRETELYQRVCRRYDLDPKKLYGTDQRAWDNEGKRVPPQCGRERKGRADVREDRAHRSAAAPHRTRPTCGRGSVIAGAELS